MAKKKENVCKTCQFYIDDKCEHSSNIKYLIHRRIEKKEYISLKPKESCEFCLTKN